MRVGIVGTSPGNSFGGTEVLISKLTALLRHAKHEVESIYLECSFGNVFELVDSIHKFQNLDLRRFDLIITFRFPSYFVQHPNKVVWLLHQFRPLGDMFNTEFGMGYSIENLNTRNQLRKLDQKALGNLGDRLRVNSKITFNRLLDSTGIHAKVQMCPLSQELGLDSAAVCPPELLNYSAPFIFMGGRISPEKRNLLAIQAAQRARVGLVVAGSVEDKDYLNHLLESASTPRIAVIGRRLSSSEISWLYRYSSAVVYIPKSEDSYGFVLGEAASIGKKIITCDDSGDAFPFAKQMQGFIASPDLMDLSEVFSEAIKADVDAEGVVRRWKSFEPKWDDVLNWIESCRA